jgi:hypothetical protein
MTSRNARVWSGTEWESISSLVYVPNAITSFQPSPPSSPVSGQMWTDSDSVSSYVYSGSDWIALSGSEVNFLTYEYTASAAQTTFSGLDDNSLTLAYTPNFLQVFLNGVLLVNSTDYTATDGTSIVLVSAASDGDIFSAVSYAVFSIANVYTQSQVDANTYTQAQVDANTYTQAQVDAAIAAASDATKADKAPEQNPITSTDYTAVLLDVGKTVTRSNAAASTHTIPAQASVSWADNTQLNFLNLGAGTVTITPAVDVTINGEPLTLETSKGGSLVRTASNTWTFIPFSSGDGTPGAANFTNTATGTYTTGGKDYKYLTLSVTGSVTIDQAGLADLLVVGAGGGGQGAGGARWAGGGAGQHMYLESYFLSEGTHTVTIPGGGAQNTRGTGASIGDVKVGGGGSGGGSGVGASGSGGRADQGAGAGSNLVGGFSGGSGGGPSYYGAGGGGGSAGSGGNGTYGPHVFAMYQGGAGGAGGSGTANSITGTSVTRAGGGGGGHAAVGSAGGGNGGGVNGNGTAGAANSGSGGGGGGQNGSGAAGGSGVVIVRVAV